MPSSVHPQVARKDAIRTAAVTPNLGAAVVNRPAGLNSSQSTLRRYPRITVLEPIRAYRTMRQSDAFRPFVRVHFLVLFPSISPEALDLFGFLTAIRVGHLLWSTAQGRFGTPEPRRRVAVVQHPCRHLIANVDGGLPCPRTAEVRSRASSLRLISLKPCSTASRSLRLTLRRRRFGFCFMHSYGERMAKPIATCCSRSCWAKGRRVRKPSATPVLACLSQ